MSERRRVASGRIVKRAGQPTVYTLTLSPPLVEHPVSLYGTR